MANKTRKASDQAVRNAWAKYGTISRVAQRIGYSVVGAARRLYKLGLVNTKTARSK